MKMRKAIWLAILVFACLPGISRATVQDTTFTVTFNCTGTTGPYSFVFPISDPTALTVTQSGTVLASTAYTVAPVNNNYANGGSVTLITACPASGTLVLSRNTPLTQNSVFTDNMPIPYKTFERGLDKLTEIDQEIDAEVSSITTNGACFPASTCQLAGTIPTTPVGFSTSPSFNATLDTSYSMTMTGNVTSSTITGKPLNGNLLSLTLTQNSTGGYTFAFPSNFVFTPTFVFQTAANAINELTFKYDGTNWHLISNGGGSGGSTLPGGNSGDVQKNSGSNTFIASGINDTGAVINHKEDVEFIGPNPYVDVRSYGARPVYYATLPSGTVTMSASSTTATLSSASAWQNGDGITILGAGPTPTMSTPNAPAATASIAAQGTGTGLVVNAPNGSTTYQYQIVGRDIHGGMTAASPVVTITNGAATLGSVQVNLTSCSRATNVVTCTTSTAHGLSVGAMVYIIGTSDDLDFGGWPIINTVPDTSHFTYLSNIDARGYNNGQGVSATGGTVRWFNCNHLQVASPGAGVWQYYIYGRTSGSMTLLGATAPTNSTWVGSPLYLTWDDFGSTMSMPPTLPSYIPNTPQSSASNDNLTTTIVSGAGTTTLTLANASSNAVSGATALFDDGPGLVAAATASHSTGGMVYIPAASQGLYYPINSYTKLPYLTGVSQAGVLSLNETLDINGAQWYGNLTVSSTTFTQQGFQGYSSVQVVTAYPGLYSSNLVFVSGIYTYGANPNGLIWVIDNDSNIPGSTFENDSIITALSGNDYLGIGMIVRGGSDHFFRKIAMGSNQLGGGAHATPVLFLYSGQVTMQDLYLNYRSIQSYGAGVWIKGAYRSQGASPFLAFAPSTPGVVVEIDNLTQDTDADPVIAQWGGGYSATAILNNTCCPSGPPLVSGLPLLDTIVSGEGGNYAPNLNAITTQSGVIAAPNYTQGQTGAGATVTSYSQPLIFNGNPGFNIIWPLNAPTNISVIGPTSGGGLGVGTINYTVAAIGFDGGISAAAGYSSAYNCTTTSGNQTCTISWTAVPGATAYRVYRCNPGGFGNGCGGLPSTASTTYVDTGGSGGGNLTNIPGSGIISIGYDSNQRPMISTPELIVPATTVPTGVSGATYHYTDPTANWPAFKANGATALVAGFSGIWSQGQCAVASSTTNVFNLGTCGTGGSGNTTSTSLTTNVVPKANGANSIVNSSITDNGSAVSTTEGFTAATVTATSLTTGNCVQASTSGLLTTVSGPCGTSSGTITATGSPVASELAMFSGATSITNSNLSGDVTTSNTLATTVGKLENIALPTLAANTGFLYDASGTLSLSASASNLTAGTLPVAQLPTIPNASLANAATTVNSQTCTLGSTCTIPFQTVGVNNTSQAGLNLVASSVNSVGLTATPINTGTNVDEIRITGSSYTGNAATATALAANPTTCSAGQAPLGIVASGNATGCFTPSGVLLQTNTSSNASQTTLNFLTSTTNTDGLTVTPSNSTSTEKFEVTGTCNTTAGCTGVSAPTAHTIPVAEGLSPMTFIYPNAAGGYVLTSNGIGADPSFQAVPGNNMSGGTQYGMAYAAGATTITSNAPPTTKGLWYPVWNLSSDAAAAPTNSLAGIVDVGISGSTSTYTVAYSNSLQIVEHDSAATHLVTVTIPTPTTLENTQFGFSYVNHTSSYTDVLSPTTWTINGSATLNVAPLSQCRVSVDPVNSNNWLADCSPSTAFVGVTSIATTSPISGGTITSTGTISCPTCAIGPGASVTSGNVASFNGTGGLIIQDSDIAAANLVTAASNYSGNLVTGTNGAKTTSDSGIAPATVVTCASAGTSGDLIQFAGANRTCSDSSIATSNVAQINIANNFSANAASSAPTIKFTGTTFSGNGTTSTPLFLLESGSAVSSWSTAGTYQGFNAASGFTGNFFDAHLNGGASLFSVNYQGNLIAAGTVNGVTMTNVVLASSPGAGVAHFAGSTQTVTSSLVALTDMATQAADTVLMNATGGSAAPTAVAMPTTGTNGCAGTTDNLIYNTSTHSLGCHQITGGGGSLTSSGLTAYYLYGLSGSTLTAAEASSSSTVMPGICVASSSTVCVYSGVVTNGSWTWTADGVIYASDGPVGTMTQTAPSTSGHFVQRVGIATSTTSMLVMPSLDVVTIQ